MAEWVSAIATASFREGSFPSRLKETVVKPTLKKPGLATDDLSNFRPIAIVPFLGKVVEGVAAVRLQSCLEINHILDPFQSGFRPLRGTETALVALQDDLLREADRGSSSLLVLLDLSAAFDTVDHGNLLARLAEAGIGGQALAWLRSFLGGRTQRVQLGDALSAPWTLPCGVPQGSAISPVLFNVYMRPLGEVIRRYGVRCHQYADDTQLYISFSSSAEEAVRSLDLCLEAVLEWTRDNRLKLNPEKTEVLFFGAPSSRYNGPLPRLGGISLQPTDRARNLGVVLDSALSLEAQVMAVSRAAFFHLRRIAQIRQYLDESSLRTVVQALVISRIDYCNALYVGLPLTLVRRLQRVQNAAARLVVGARRYEHITPVLVRLHWLPVVFRIRFKVLVLTFKALHGLGPGYLAERISQRTSGSRPTRSSQARSLRVATPREARKTRTRNRAFSVVGPSLWNHLPPELRLLESLPAFKKALKTFLFKEAYGDLSS